jgi:hypothetical protein
MTASRKVVREQRAEIRGQRSVVSGQWNAESRNLVTVRRQSYRSARNETRADFCSLVPFSLVPCFLLVHPWREILDQSLVPRPSVPAFRSLPLSNAGIDRGEGEEW